MKISLTLASLCLLATSAMAHDTWLLPRAALQDSSNRMFDLTSGMAFPELETAIAADRVAVAYYRLGGEKKSMAPGTSSDHSLEFKTSTSKSGVGTVWVSLKPRQLDLKQSSIAEYLDEIGASASLRAAVKQQQGRRWREVYSKHAKTFTASGTDTGGASNDRSWAEPTQQALEIVPDTDPLQLKAGDVFKAHVLRHGKPFPMLAVGIVGEKNTSIAFQTTDASGSVSFRVPARGRWLIRATDLRAASKADIEWESDFTTLTFDVR